MKGRHLPGAKPSSAPSPRQPMPNDLPFGERIHNLISEELERAKNDKARAFHAVVARLKDDPALFERGNGFDSKANHKAAQANDSSAGGSGAGLR